jgi:hypothetical protein
MPALAPVPNAVKTRVIFGVEGDPQVATHLFFAYTGGPPTETDIAHLATDLVTAAASLASLFTATTNMLAADARDLSSDMGAYANENSGGVPGTRTGDRLSPGTCALTNFRIKRSYRGGRPRAYWPFGSGTDIAASGLWTSSFVSEYSAAIVALIGSIAGNVYPSFTVTNQINISWYGPPNVIVTNPVTGRARTVSTRRVPPVKDTIISVGGSQVISSQRKRNRAA